MRIHLASDHAGFHLKSKIAALVRELGHELVDHGPHAYDPDDDFPPYCLRAARGTVDDAGSLGIVVGGSGNGEAIAANKVKDVRCALVYDEATTLLGRQHNDANVMALGARMIAEGLALSLVEIFLSTPFSGEERHARRIAQLSGYEQTGELPPL